MENASKALIMAGSVLIALLVVGSLVLMFSNLTSYQNTKEIATKDEQITKFNQEYSTYNRKDLRGNELYSLINKVVDYNRRESTAGTSNTNETWADKGATIAYEPMEVKFEISAEDKKNISADHSANRLINQTIWDINGNTNTFTIKQKVENLEKTFGQDSLTNLVTGMSEIFISNSSTDNEKMEAINNFNSACKSKSLKLTEWNKISPTGEYTQAVYTYYEYIQFKRLHFDCIGVKYSQKTGRIIKLSFESTRKFN